MDIPIELFFGLIAVSIVLTIIGIAKKAPPLILATGLVIIIIAVMTDNIILGKIPESSTISGATTTYVMVDNLFLFTEWHKLITMIIGAIIMLGAWYARE